MIIRRYVPQDREAVRSISVATPFLGRPAALFFDGQEVLADLLTLYHTDHEPQSCLVAEAEGKVVGYLIGAIDTRLMEKVFIKKIFWPTFKKAFCQGIFAAARNWRLLGRIIASGLQGRFFMPDFYEQYPATLHINILEGYRSAGVGGQLMDAFLAYLRSCGVRGVRLATMSEEAGRFFVRHGFVLLHRSTRSYFRDIIQRDVGFYVYGQKGLC